MLMVRTDIAGDRGEGKTTRLLEWAIEALADNPDHEVVIIAAPDRRWAQTLAEGFAELEGCRIISPVEMARSLRGHSTNLIIGVDNIDLMSPEHLVYLREHLWTWVRATTRGRVMADAS